MKVNKYDLANRSLSKRCEKCKVKYYSKNITKIANKYYCLDCGNDITKQRFLALKHYILNLRICAIQDFMHSKRSIQGDLLYFIENLLQRRFNTLSIPLRSRYSKIQLSCSTTADSINELFDIIEKKETELIT